MPHEQNSDALLEITVQWGEDGDVVVLAGEFDFYAASRVRAAVNALLASGRRRIIIDLDAVTFMDGAAIGALISAHEQALRVGGSLEVTEHAVCRRLLRLTGELQRLPFHRFAAEAGIDHAVGSAANAGPSWHRENQ